MSSSSNGGWADVLALADVICNAIVSYSRRTDDGWPGWVIASTLVVMNYHGCLARTEMINWAAGSSQAFIFVSIPVHRQIDTCCSRV
jgi:hypothetical protein